LHLGVEEDFRPARREHPAILFRALDPIARRLAAAGQDMTRGRDFPLRRGIDAVDPFGTRPKFLEQIAASGRRLAGFTSLQHPCRGYSRLWIGVVTKLGCDPTGLRGA
jgi:hypothetical protein